VLPAKIALASDPRSAAESRPSSSASGSLKNSSRGAGTATGFHGTKKSGSSRANVLSKGKRVDGAMGLSVTAAASPTGVKVEAGRSGRFIEAETSLGTRFASLARPASRLLDFSRVGNQMRQHA
jgi:hypothetical protein